jgi:sulfate adenylyltransferase (ADP) / ATP adenylyltransferase
MLQQSRIPPQRLLDLCHPLDVQCFVQIGFEFVLSKLDFVHALDFNGPRWSRKEDGLTRKTGFQRGTLWTRVIETQQRAFEQGALRPIPTSFEILQDGQVSFLIRVVQHLKERPRSTRMVNQGPDRNPFLPYDPALFVVDAGARHVCLLNKFNVVDHHLLIITRDFVHQCGALNPDDFSAWWRCLVEYESLGFYNGGVRAGASQPHRHLQLIPLPLHDSGPPIPIEPILDLDCPRPRFRASDDRVPFDHALVRVPSGDDGSSQQMGDDLYQLYVELLGLVGIAATGPPDGPLSGAYNLLLTRRWMLLVPRRHEHFAGISLNAMAFAGAFLARDHEQREVLRRQGPMAALAYVAGKP